ncbi:MAG: LAGLIDADG family homing endonuclease [Patescibacteria group bacterium]
MNISLLQFPNKSHRKSVLIPDHNANLAELLGIIFGDGAIGNPWQVVISLNSILDRKYASYVTQLFNGLFGITCAVRKRPNQNTLVVVCSSTTIVDYLIEKGATRGNKLKQNLDIPSWIKNDNNFLKFFIRGLVDTDGCIYLHRHFIKQNYYVNIGLCFTNFSTDIITSVDIFLKQNGIKSHVADKGRRIYLYTEESVKKYLDIFGSSNPRIYEKYTDWKNKKITGGV